MALTADRSAVEMPEIRAMRLAALHRVSKTQPVLNIPKRPGRKQQLPARPKLFNRLNTQRLLLHDVYLLFVRISKTEELHSFAAEWLLDNYYIVQQAMRQIREDMPEKFYRELPLLETTRQAGYPRIYAIAHELVAQNDARVDAEQMERFINAYQTIAPLTMGEMWALPVMLRFNIIETLSRACTVALDIATLDEGAMGDYFSSGAPPDTVVANSITSLRALSVYDWKSFVERSSLVERALSHDPADVYAHMDFESRDRYRKVIEELAKKSSVSQVGIAREAIHLARQASLPNWDEKNRSRGAEQRARESHVGFYLMDEGRAVLEREIGYQASQWERVQRWLLSHPTLTYLSSIFLPTFLMVLVFALYANRALLNLGSPNGWVIGVVVALTLIPAMTFIVSLVNAVVTLVMPPRQLLKLDYSRSSPAGGIPDERRALIVIPALLSGPEEIDSLIRQLELHYLRNDDNNLSFALLTDFNDAPQQSLPDDRALLQRALDGIEKLRRNYQKEDGAELFLFLHRERQWNEREGTWMGWERKRGKLEEFSRLLGGNNQTSFTTILGNWKSLLPVRYIITLDADTVLPEGGAARLIGTLAHPLNTALFADGSDRIDKGYAILQPRTEIKPASANQTRFTRIFTGDTGLDLYTHAVSDVYQDLFGEGIFVGKGILDRNAFKRAVDQKIPENALLSHDLLEGLLSRAGLVSDILLYEEFPPTYLAYVQRMHRWIRGDWQLLPWLFSVSYGRKSRASLGILDRWKITDNLRRSLFAPLLLLLLVLGWLWLPGSPLFWTLVVVFISATPVLTALVSRAARQTDRTPGENPTQIWPGGLNQNDKNQALRWLLSLAFLPYETLVTLDAVGKTIWRLFTRQKMLEWRTAAMVANVFRNVQNPTVMIWRDMIGEVILAVVVVALVAWLRPAAMPLALPFALSWILAPQIVAWLDQPITYARQKLEAAQQKRVRSLARRTWYFFEQFVGPDDHWLPPDHFQESPRGTVAHRTSTTNIGLGMLSTLAAFDLGYSGLEECLLRINNTLNTLDQLQMYRGHFLNWYDTRTLAPLPPRYVSTVDNGNLAGSMIALAQGLHDVRRQPLMRWQQWQGLLDTLGVFEETLDSVIEAEAAENKKISDRVKDQVKALSEMVQQAKEQPQSWPALLDQMTQIAWPQAEHSVSDLINAEILNMNPALLRSLRNWVERIRFHLNSMRRQWREMTPWVEAFNSPPALWQDPSLRANLQQTWQELQRQLPLDISLEGLVQCQDTVQDLLERLCAQLNENNLPSHHKEEASVWIETFSTAFQRAARLAIGWSDDANEMIHRLERFAWGMDFHFLYNPQRHIFHIGYNIDAERMDANYYDLLASESRIASLVAIAKDDVPIRHWLHLGRPLTQVTGGLALLSWSGTMFEYLMPPLILREYPNTLLHQSSVAAVKQQIQYGEEKGVPWGISESGFYYFDASQNYQYRAFGAPGLGFKRGLSDDLVITPYASLLALPYAAGAVMHNFEKLIRMNALADYGLYEAIDFTAERLPLGAEHAVVRSFMAHHQGMILLAISNFLMESAMVERFHANPRIQSVEMLLQEQIPTDAPLEQLTEEDEEAPAQMTMEPHVLATPWELPVDGSLPLVHYLSNGRYSVMLTNKGGGYSQWLDRAITRWRADTTLDDWGTFLYLQDLESGKFWTVGSQLVPSENGEHDVFFSPYKADYHNKTDGINTHVQISVSPDDDIEVRWVRVSNTTDEPRKLAITSYAELALAPQDADRRHPAFNKMVIESEYYEGLNALIFRRRPRAANESPVFVLHALLRQPKNQHGNTPIEQLPQARYDSNRLTFLGRGRSVRSPQAMSSAYSLAQESGPVLDPVMALQQEIEMPPHSSFELGFITLAADSRQSALMIARRYQDWNRMMRIFDQARYASEIEMRRLEITSNDIENYQKLLSVLIYPRSALRAAPDVLADNNLGQPGLWPYAISGDYPILLLTISEREDVTLLRELLHAHSYWRSRGLMIDLVVLTEKESGYGQEVHERVYQLIQRTNNGDWLNRRGGIFLLRRDQLKPEEMVLLQTVARAILSSGAGPLNAQIQSVDRKPVSLPGFTPVNTGPAEREATPPIARPQGLQFDNGWGGFSADGSEYLIYVEPGKPTPAPWINVIANQQAGFWVSESGGGYSWAFNSGENRLTPWSNDPVSDSPGEALYLRDEETAEIWSPTPLPAGESTPYLVRHGAGYSSFEHNSHGLKQVLSLFMHQEEPVKVIRLRLENIWQRERRITATYYAEWVLGVNRDQMQTYIINEYDSEHSAILARNPYNVEFGQRVAFLAASKNPHGVTADRIEFLGRGGSNRRPAALERVGLSSRVIAGLDPCAAIQIHIDMQPGETQEIYFLLGQGQDKADALRIMAQLNSLASVNQALQDSTTRWEELLSTVQVQSPNPAVNIALNRWLLYQDLSCRIWGRSALYQSSGAYGFRDQLQDVMALTFAAPEITRQHILYAATRQFEAGDVLHWWHPPSGRGVRTRIRDDLLFLPYVTADYILATGDTAILDEKMPFLIADPLKHDEEDRYGDYPQTAEHYSLYEHCKRALRNGITLGERGLPLMEAGDWNDGMNRVGIEGKGESVWLGWFLYTALTRFEPICRLVGDEQQAQAFHSAAERLRNALHQNAWDGEWYLRAFFDDGTPLGSAQSDECQIDSIAQSWAVISRAGDPERSRMAMDSVLKMLVQQDGRLIRLFTPAFDKTAHDPGYIKAYPPGIRENGGQYTHAAIWTVWAFALMGRGNLAFDLFQMLNPLTHADTPEEAARYRVEPYVVAADVYSVPPHTGRGGWTWYTGSGGWLYRLGVEAILGLDRRNNHLLIDPCIPADWREYTMTYRYGKTTYHIQVTNPQGASCGVGSVTLDGKEQPELWIPLADDGKQHNVLVQLDANGKRPASDPARALAELPLPLSPARGDRGEGFLARSGGNSNG